MRRLGLALVLIVVSLCVSARAQVPSPTVTGPIGDAGLRHHALFDSWVDLSDLGYTEDEYFVSGTATSAAATTAPYTTRIIVTRPASAATFNGTVVLDWTNVTAQFENAVDTLEAREMLLREGFAWVHASVQAAGICCTPLTPKIWDPVRYGSLSHPGDEYAFDIFSQLAQAIRAPAGVDPMGGLTVERVLAAGQSQSASLLYDYVTTADRGVIDGFLIHGGGSKTYATPPAEPVLHLLSDAEADPAEPNTSMNYRLWEIAGTAHSDFWLGYHQVFGQGPRTLADAPKQPASAEKDLNVTAGNYGEIIHPMDATCILAGATMPMRYAVSSALVRLNEWVKTGVAPPNGPRFQFASGTLAMDQYGNALGGIRLPPIDVPVASYVSTICVLGGLTIPFPEPLLLVLYPTHADYYGQMVTKANDAVTAGWLLADDAQDLLVRACAAKIRWQDLSGTGCD